MSLFPRHSSIDTFSQMSEFARDLREFLLSLPRLQFKTVENHQAGARIEVETAFKPRLLVYNAHERGNEATNVGYTAAPEWYAEADATTGRYRAKITRLPGLTTDTVYRVDILIVGDLPT